jgi:ATP-dependent DNA helicase RecG
MVGVEALLNDQRIESSRIEFKAGWNPDSIYRSICAFANDVDNIGGGYILVGIEEIDGIAARPPRGLSDTQIAAIQREMIGFNALITPAYAPRVFIEEVDGRQVLAIWAYGGLERPYEVPTFVTAKKKKYCSYIRRYASTIEARGRDLQDLVSVSQQIPFDDRLHPYATVSDINLLYIQEYLRKSKSRLFQEVGRYSPRQLLSHLNLIEGDRIRNVALMLFCDEPQTFFPYSYIEVVHFSERSYARTFDETQFSGPMHVQLMQALDYVRSNVVVEKVTKIDQVAEADRVFNYPFSVIEEALVNAIYHRRYDEHEPVTIRIEPHRIMIYNCGGPDRSIPLADLQSGRAVAMRYRNRRLGDFLKEMDLAEARSTGLALIHRDLELNGSPPPIIETDEERSYFSLTLEIHNAFIERENGFEVRETARMTTLRAIANAMSNQAGNQGDERKARVLIHLTRGDASKEELMSSLGISSQTKNTRRYLLPLLEEGFIERTVADKPTSPLQRYRLTAKGRALVKGL